jgi:serine/threonine protein kinase
MLDDENTQTPQLTLSSDVWSFACTAYEVCRRFFLFDHGNFDLITCCLTKLLTGRLPYHNRHRDFSVISDILQGVKPGGPDASLSYAPGPQDKIWSLLSRCWAGPAEWRPRMIEVEAELDK